MKTIYRSEDRGFADHGWLKTAYSFSFAGYYNPERIQYGKLRVFNDDIIEAGGGFGKHPHDNMEIVTIILEGKLAHKDSAGNEHVSSANGIQVMSAGTGIYHSEYNGSDYESTKLLQIWVFPDRKGHIPRYDQGELNTDMMINNPYLFVGPKESGSDLWINQNAYFSMAIVDDAGISYKKYKKDNGIYIFLIDGEITIGEEQLSKRDAMTIDDEDDIELASKIKSQVLIIEVPK